MMGERHLAVVVIVTALLTIWAWVGQAETPLERSEFQKVIAYHVDSYSEMEIQDLYKLVFQAAMGSEHAVSDRRAAQQWLEREISTMSLDRSEPLSEPLSPDGALVRVNLRAFVERGGDIEKLLDVFVSTADRYQGSQEKLARYWSYLESMSDAGEIPFDRDHMQELFTKMQTEGFPAVRHSSTYRDRYQPAYRVVLLELLGSETPAITGQ